MQADFEDFWSIRNFASKIKKEYKKFDFLINTVEYGDSSDSFSEDTIASRDIIDKTFDINVKGAI